MESTVNKKYKFLTDQCLLPRWLQSKCITLVQSRRCSCSYTAAPWTSPREGLVPYSDMTAVTSPGRGINQPHPDLLTPSSPP